ncbi:hypothetical protein [Umezawaea sp. Da 62-37]|uniref:hypothetical protein n=1 Tax=Umezawaea sp. Da 62-37 TaxID=3075927 RepID=UPI0028F6D9BD|nr:hypothetical protein [Umezawaea sp. Da 62-37]WNV83710.1 hypothetical protein RM788_36840 [Umezawaea sp. Da 62-37]
MIVETKDRDQLKVYIPDDVADRETRAAAADRRWRSWSCPGCGSTHAGYSVDVRAAACSHCVDRIRRGLPILDAKGLWEEALEFKDAVPLSVGDLRQAAELKAELSPEVVHASAVAADPEWISMPDGRLVCAVCASCGGAVDLKAGGVRLGDMFVCAGCRGAA